MAQALKVGDGTGLGQGKESQQAEGGEGRQGQECEATDHRGEAAVRSGAQGTDGHGEHDNDHQLRQHEGNQGLGQSATPGGQRRPHHGHEDQGQEGHRHVDGRSPDHQLEPEGQAGECHGGGGQQEHEGGRGRTARDARSDQGGGHLARERAKHGAGRPCHRPAQLIGGSEAERGQLDRRAGEQHPEGQLHQHHPDQQAEVLAQHGPDHGKQQHRKGHHRQQRLDGAIALEEPRGRQVDGRR